MLGMRMIQGDVLWWEDYDISILCELCSCIIPKEEIWCVSLVLCLR